MKIVERLFDIMEKKNLKSSDLAKKLEVKNSVISSWKTRQTDPPSKFIIRICEFLDVDIYYFLTGESNNTGSFFYDPFICSYLDFESREKQLFQSFISSFIEYQASISQQNIATLPVNSTVREIGYFYKLASAGSGQLLFDTPPSKLIEIPDIPDYKKASYAIGVNGDSMEPLYFDGDIVLVEVTPIINKDEVGIFEVDGECYIKKYGGDQLISINEKYPNISLNSHSRCLGKVIDVLR